MNKKPTRLIGLSYSDFITVAEQGKDFHLHPAKLLPTQKRGDEKALTTIFLSSLRLIKEFRKGISSNIGLSQAGKIYVFTEVKFPSYDGKHNTPDGLIIIVRGRNIIDAALLEVKNKRSELDEEQICCYLKIANDYGIPKVLTVSNQFVNYPTQSPLSIKLPRNIDLYHFSWSYVLTIAHLLLFDNDENIEDEDQVEIMKEVLDYLESNDSGVFGFNRMKPGWAEIVDKVNAGVKLDLNDKSVDETITSWIEEERDMGLILSRELGLFVNTGDKKFRNNLQAKIDYEKKQLISYNYLDSSLQISGAVSDLKVRANFDKKNLEMSVNVISPQDKKSKGQIGWMLRQLNNCQKKNPELFTNLEKSLMIDILIKFQKEPIRFRLDEIDSALEKVGNREIKGFNIVCLQYLGRKFRSPQIFVEVIEKMVIDYYRGIVQYLKNWNKPAPQIHTVDEQ